MSNFNKFLKWAEDCATAFFGVNTPKKDTSIEGDLSKNFSASEFSCKHCGEENINPELIDALQRLRDMVGVPIDVNSGYRCPQHPESIKSPTSQHVKGNAADIVIRGFTVEEMYSAAKKIPEFMNGGIGVYDDGFIHVDVRGQKARWARKNGEYIGIEEFFS